MGWREGVRCGVVRGLQTGARAVRESGCKRHDQLFASNLPLIDSARRVASKEHAAFWGRSVVEEEDLTVHLVLVAIEDLHLAQLGHVPANDLLVIAARVEPTELRIVL